jgi:Raf kinase inhibitor-like YbhB/YbcL family protein
MKILIWILIFTTDICIAQIELKQVEGNMNITLKSGAFKEGEFIPKKFTCDGENVSPPLEWGEIPKGTKSIAIICDDPDAPRGTWVHWVIYNIPPSTISLQENIPYEKVLEDGTIQGKNDFRKIGYGGPCPPNGIHRYFFKIYALSVTLALAPGLTKGELLHAMEEHIISEGKLMGKYNR